MAKKDAFLLVSLEEDKAKKLASVIGNESCRKIIDYLAGKDDATETELAESLNIPISTVHYNVQLLQNSGLAVAEEFHYSKKGREVLHYKLANRYIVIAPKATESVPMRLKRLLPVLAIVAAAGIAIQIFNTLKGAAFAGYGGGSGIAQYAAEKAAAPALQEAAYDAMLAANETAMAAAARTAEAAGQLGVALWFVIGALFALSVYLVYDFVKERQK